MTETAASRRARRDQRQAATPGPKKRAPRRRPIWQTVLLGLAVVAGAFAIAVVLTGEGPPEATETAPVAITGAPLAPIPQDPSTDPSVGQPAPGATGQDFDGDRVELLDDDSGTVLVFLAHWCNVCQSEVPVIVDEFGDGLPDGVRLVGVPTSTDPTQGNYPPSAWLAAEDWEFDVLVDSADHELGRAYGVQAYPAFVVVGPDGVVRARASGALPPADLRRLVDAARA